MLFVLAMPSDNERGPQYAELFFNALHSGNSRLEPITLHYASPKGSHALYVRCSSTLAPLVSNQLKASYPNATVEKCNDTALTPSANQSVFTADLTLRPDFFPVQRLADFDDQLTRDRADPLAGLLAALQPRAEGMVSRIDLTIQPVRSLHRPALRHRVVLLRMKWLRKHNWLFEQAARFLSHPVRPVRWGTWLLLACVPAKQLPNDVEEVSNRSHQRETDLDGALDKVGRHLFRVRLRLFVFTDADRQNEAEQVLSDMAAAFSQFVVPRRSQFEQGAIRGPKNWPVTSRSRSWLASSEELSSLWHPATSSAQTRNMSVASYRQLDPPADLLRKKEEGIAVLGRTDTLHLKDEFGLMLDDRRRHLAIVGKTGMGKSTLLNNLVTADIQNGRGVVLIDPHGDLAEEIADQVPRSRTADVLYFDAGDREYPIAFNPLSHHDPSQRALVASGVVAAFKKMFADSWGPRLEHILRNALLALLESPNTTLISLNRMLFDAAYCKGITSRVSDPAVSAFWATEWKGWRESYRNEAIAPVLNKLGHFLSNPILRSIVGQERSRVDLRRIIDNEQVLIANLSKGKIGEDACNLLGSFLISSLQLAAMSRADMAEAERRDCFLYVDEFQNFATDSFAAILSEARKYRLNLTIANQYLEQIEDSVLAAVFGNVGSLLSFQVGPRDAEAMAEQFGGYVTTRDMIQLPKYHAYVRLLIEGASSQPFSMTTLPPSKVLPNRLEIVRKQSRQRYAKLASTVDREIESQFTLAA